MEIRLVTWLDSSGTGRWTSLTELRSERPRRITSVGFVLCESEDHVTLMQSHDPPIDDDHLANGDNTITIPRFAIVESETVVA